ncbi:MAG: ankyrin repeat domain-containing protein [Verrucomicrobia bacterium]|nr:ankyrin repeat domain-containing protein [Verrucomicrobiota bacterium]
MNVKGPFATSGIRGLLVTLILILPSPAFAQRADEEGEPEKLLRAIRRHDTNAVVRLLSANARLADAPSFGERRPLLQAAAEGSIEIVDLLLKAGADINAVGDTWDTSNKRISALHVAVWYGQKGRLEIVKRLLEGGANPNSVGPSDGGPLHMAFSSKRDEIAALLLDHGANPFLLKPFPWNNKQSALELAIIYGDGKLVPRMLHDRSAAESFLRTNGFAMLAAAANRGQLESVRALLEAGASPKESVKANRSLLQSFALSASASAGHPDASATNWAQVRDLLRENGAEYDMFAATGFGDLDETRRLASADLNLAGARDYLGETPLHWAVRTDRLPLTSFWIEYGASTSATNLAGQTPLHLAAANGLTAHVQRLLAANAPTDTRDNKGHTPLDSAIQAKQTETIRLLLASTEGPPLDRSVATTIHEAAASGNIVALTEFATPKNLEARNELGLTPLHLAAQRGQLGAAAFLLDKGANVKARDPEGNSVLHLILLSRTPWIAGHPSNAWIERQKQDPQKEKLLRLLTATNDFQSVNHVAASVAFFLACGADAGAKNKSGKTTLKLAMDEHTMLSDEDRAALLPLFSQGGDGLDARDENGETALHRAAREILGDNTGALIAAGADLNATNNLGRTPLHAAVEKLGGWGDSQPFTLILNAKPNVNAQDNEGLTPLHVLVLSDSIFIREATEALLAAGADPNLRDEAGRTPLLSSLAGKWPWRAAGASLGQLVAARAKTDAADNQGNTALHYFARMGHQSPMFFVPEAASQFASLDVNTTNRAGDTPLHVAARAGTTDVFDWLRSRGARLDVTNAAGETPHQLGRGNSSPFARFNLGLPAELESAAQRGEVETLERALNADPSLLNATNRAGETALGIAARSGQTNLAASLLQKGARWDAVSATLLGRADVLKDLLARNPATLTNASHGKQLIHLAAESGDVIILGSLLSAGADVEARARSGLSPLGIALLHKRDAAVAMLRARGASENLFDAVVLDLPEKAVGLLALKPSLGREANQFEFTPMHLAVALERQAILKFLLDEQVSPDIPAGRTRISPLHVAAACNRTNAIRLLIERGAKTELTDNSGCTPLHYAAGRGSMAAAALLLKLGAKPDIPVFSEPLRMRVHNLQPGNTALHFAVTAGQSNIVALLLEAGANVNATNSFGQTPLDLTRPGMPMSPQWGSPLSSPGGELAMSFRSMGLPQLATLIPARPAWLDSPNNAPLATMLERAGGRFGTVPNFAKPR